MKHQKTQQSETLAAQAKQGIGGKLLPITGLGLGIFAIVVTIICSMMFGCASPSRPSTPAELEVQKEFQQKLDTITKIFQQKLESSPIEFQQKLEAATKEFQENIEAATKEAKYKLDLIKEAEHQ